jgi:hypothetical protein
MTMRFELGLRDDIGPALIKAGLNGNVCEVGVDAGEYFAQIMRCKPKLAVAVDGWELCRNTTGMYSAADLESFAKGQNAFFAKFGQCPNVQIVNELSFMAAAKFTDGFFDFVYIDASHDYDSASHDIAAWLPKVKRGGVLGGHDYNEGNFGGQPFGVIRAVDELIAAKGWREHLTFTRDARTSWFVGVPQ